VVGKRTIWSKSLATDKACVREQGISIGQDEALMDRAVIEAQWIAAVRKMDRLGGFYEYLNWYAVSVPLDFC